MTSPDDYVLAGVEAGHSHLYSEPSLPRRVRDISRRRFLTAAATFGAGAVLAAEGAVRTIGAARKPRLIDVRHHVFPPEFLAAGLESYIPLNRAVVSAWTPQKALAEMDLNGVATAIGSLTSPCVWFGDVEGGRGLARKSNEYMARLARDYPGRFGFFATLPLPDTEGSLHEIAYSLDVLKADGIGLMTNYNDRWPGDSLFAPVLEELNRRKAVLFFHPTAPSCCRDLVPNVPRAWAEMPNDTTRAVLSLLVSGTLSRLRNIRFIFFACRRDYTDACRTHYSGREFRRESRGESASRHRVRVKAALL